MRSYHAHKCIHPKQIYPLFLLNEISHFFIPSRTYKKKKIQLKRYWILFFLNLISYAYTVVNSPSRDIYYEITVYRHAINTVSRILRHVFTPCFGLGCQLHAYLTSSSSNEQITVTAVCRTRSMETREILYPRETLISNPWWKRGELSYFKMSTHLEIDSR